MADANQLAQTWVDQMSQAGAKYKAGITNVKESPMEKAAMSEDKWLAGVQEAKTTGKWARGLRKKSLSEWKTAATTTGADRLATGARAAKDKMVKHLAAWMPVAEDIKATAAAMPSGGIEDSIAKVRMSIQKAKEFKSRSA